MKIKIKSIDLNNDISLLDYRPDRIDDFSISITFTIGEEETEGGDLFLVNACAPKWLSKNVNEGLWGRHILIVEKYDPHIIASFVNSHIERIEESSWIESAEKISRFMQWEFEDYQQ